MSSLRRRLLRLASLGAALSVAAAGCSGGDPRFGGETIEDPARFISTLEQRWQADIADANLTKHPDGRCYFSAPEGSRDVEPLAYCGPVRHYIDPGLADGGTDGAVGQGVWDTYRFDGAPIKDGYRLGNPTQDSRGNNVPEGDALFRPDGKEPPKDAADLALPKPPPAEPGLMGASGFGQGLNDDDPDDRAQTLAEPRLVASRKLSGMVVPLTNRNLVIDEVGTTDQVLSPDGTRTPAKGEEFVVLKMHITPGIWNKMAQEADSNSSFRHATRDHPSLDIRTSAGEERLGNLMEDQGKVSVVASVPAGDPNATLIVWFYDREKMPAAKVSQTVSFRSGVIDAFPSTSLSTPINKSYRQQFTRAKFTTEFSAEISDGYLAAYFPMTGWAPKGKLWLVLKTDGGWSEPDFWRLEPDQQATWSATAAGTRVPNEAMGELVSGDVEDDWPVFAVDPAARSFQVTVRPTFSYEQLSAFAGPIESGSGAMKAMTFEINFPK